MLLATLCLLALVAPLQDEQASEALQTPQWEEVVDAMDWQTGPFTVEGGLATIDLPEGWAYLQATEAQYMVEKLWGNPPDSGVLGLVAPPGDRVGWGVIVSFDADGYVEGSDVANIDYDKLLEDMLADTLA